jgi:hypothetical protein
MAGRSAPGLMVLYDMAASTDMVGTLALMA